MRGVRIPSVAATNAPGHGTTPTVLFHDRDISAGFLVSAIAPLIAPSITPTLLVGTLGIPALTPPFTPLIFLLPRIANADLRAPIGAEAELNARLSHRRRADKKTGSDRGCSQKGKFSHGFNPLGDRDLTSGGQGGSNPWPHRGTLPHTQEGFPVACLTGLLPTETMREGEDPTFESCRTQQLSC
jgi:hypothetical protein